ncbi:Protein RecA [Geodia barretti]|uniref:Protein RecA n=1 Tax=Geodia barretti TaxID=519541 RepID=A0AA35TCN7_GEOBA|nr:Protein RecA [Geodia barretti]
MPPNKTDNGVKPIALTTDAQEPLPMTTTIKPTNESPPAIDELLGDMERRFGEGSLMRLGDVSARLTVDGIPTGALSLDVALGIGGLPRGRIVEAAYVDVEHALDPEFASRLGIDVSQLLIAQPDTGEQALEIVEALVRSNAIDVVVVDSVAALVPRAEIEGEMGDTQVGLQARLMCQALRKLTGVVARSKTVLIFINQLREKVGIVFGNPETTPGGRALKFYSSVRIELRRAETLKDGQVVIGTRVKAKVVKNKVAPPFRTAEFDLMFTAAEHGISKTGCLIDLGIEPAPGSPAGAPSVIKKQGTFYSYGETRLGQGRERTKAFLREHPEIAEEIEARIREERGLPNAKSLLTADGAPKSKPIAKPPPKKKGRSRMG